MSFGAFHLSKTEILRRFLAVSHFHRIFDPSASQTTTRYRDRQHVSFIVDMSYSFFHEFKWNNEKHPHFYNFTVPINFQSYIYMNIMLNGIQLFYHATRPYLDLNSELCKQWLRLLSRQGERSQATGVNISQQNYKIE